MSVDGMTKGIDYVFIDGLKKYFGLIDLQMSRFRSKKGIVRENTNIRQYKNNCTLELVTIPVYFCKMIFRENKGDLVNQKELMNNVQIKKEMLLIRLFDGLFRSSDNILRNILVGTDNRLISIDEGDIFGKRKHIFDKNDWCLKDTWCRQNFRHTIETCIFGEGKLQIITKRLNDFHFPQNMIDEFTYRYNNYLQIVNQEFNL